MQTCCSGSTGTNLEEMDVEEDPLHYKVLWPKEARYDEGMVHDDDAIGR